MRRDDHERERLRALVEGADWAETGGNPDSAVATGKTGTHSENAKTPPERGSHDAPDENRTRDLRLVRPTLFATR